MNQSKIRIVPIPLVCSSCFYQLYALGKEYPSYCVRFGCFRKIALCTVICFRLPVCQEQYAYRQCGSKSPTSTQASPICTMTEEFLLTYVPSEGSLSQGAHESWSDAFEDIHSDRIRYLPFRRLTRNTGGEKKHTITSVMWVICPCFDLDSLLLSLTSLYLCHIFGG
ncbi:hypothetical protein DINM_006368 [Dirofilaria immitis]|nr:hypothetical protein [Dirofilaria immitis]